MNASTSVSTHDRLNRFPANARREPGPVRHDRARIQVEGIGCAFDAARLERRLRRLVGVLGVHVNPITDYAQIAYDPGLTSPSMLVKQIEFSGFRATLR
jgi:cation transport ATPase